MQFAFVDLAGFVEAHGGTATFLNVLLGLHLIGKFSMRKLNDLQDLLLLIEAVHERALLGNFQELNEEAFLFDVTVAGAEFHEQIFQSSLALVLVGRHAHYKHPERHGIVQVLRLGQEMVQYRDAYFEDDA